MKERNMMKGLALTVVCLLMLVFIPSSGAQELETSNIMFDDTPSELDVTWIIWKWKEYVLVDFLCKAYDNESGVDRVEMYYNGEIIKTEFSPEPEFLFGSIERDKILKTDTFKFVAYNGVGLTTSVEINGSDIESVGCSNTEIEFPKENGPYFVYISGKWMGSSPSSFDFRPLQGKIQLGPLCWLRYPNAYDVVVLEESEVGPGMLAVNGNFYPIEYSSGVVGIKISGLKGFFPTGALYLAKVFSPVKWGRIRLFGICDEIDIN